MMSEENKEIGKFEISCTVDDNGREIIRMKLPPVPEGMSKRQWKKQCKRVRHEETKDEYNKTKREKKKKARLNKRLKIQAIVDRGEEIPKELKRPKKVNDNQKDSGIEIIMDCAFDDLMHEKEIASMTNQITRAFSSNRRENHFAKVTITSFNKRLKKRFDTKLTNFRYQDWRNFEFVEDEDCITGPGVDKSKLIYLTADTDEKLETLEPGMKYIVGGIVDKNRHKCLCLNKAKELGIQTRRLPIDDFIRISGRQVLTTTHVIQIMLKYFDDKNWKEAFQSTLPERKLQYGIDGEDDQTDDVVDKAADDIADESNTEDNESEHFDDALEDNSRLEL
ncbi:hypothetical protein TPHA_0A00720 [Tetrapisispora phaffii CBS 4417]|uniref:tRNA (guanine(9)-N1)-methyltransferase n=1 Tax=Tetrapisispora phaffii (strain ATCC 24235 / CBS 4417 / NBRC 1672 / NRRL Y-8282 / UCD 70-5) TaxID=1071381 RepID=G8BMM9_TETPH|nr:hypothetical protein TPHA_0A00720 [Tetrapisispora phaffii CBS 4417]CCE61157.1 hypothetical protein TPHA_0A00720 [Tetrapisispora phaffii CBS 4417]